jgi:TolB-like protein
VAPEFQEWLDVQRRTLREMASRAAWESSEAEESRGDRGSAVALARRACELDPDNEEGIRRLIALLDRRGDRSGALKVYGEWQTRLFEEYGVEPSPETRKLANRVRAARKGESHETPPTMSVPIPTRQAVAEAKRPETASTAQAAPNVPRRRTLRTAVTIGGVIIVLATSAVAMFQSDAMRTPRAGPNSVAVLPLRPIGDSTLQRASDAVSEELTTALAAREGIVVRSATRAQELLREGKDVDDLGRRLGVAFVADGSVQGDSSRLRLTIRLLRASDAVAVWAETFDFAAADLPAVARSGAEKLSAALLGSLAAPARNVP